MKMNNEQPSSHGRLLIQGQYAMVDLLGKGASGAVYLVKDVRQAQNRFVLKEVMHAVRKERRGIPFDAAVLRRLNHLALPRMYRVFPGDKHDRFYILMDYIEGPNLEVVQQSVPGKRFSLPEVVTLMAPIIHAVSYLHRQHPPLIHGDIKPSNIIVPKAGTPSVLVDFGGVKDLHTDTTAHQRTLNYRAPEQYRRGTSPRTDIYALGATFYTLLTGTVPAAAYDRLARLVEMEADPLLPMNQITPYVRTTVAWAIHCALSIQSHDRFATVEQFWEALWQVTKASQPSWLQVPEPMITPPIVGKNTGPDVNPVVTQVPELEVVVATEEHMGLDAEPDGTMPEVEIPVLLADATIQAEVASAPASPGPPLSPALPGEENPHVKVSLHERPPALRPKKPGLLANGRATSKDKRHGFAPKSQKRKVRTIFLFTLIFLLVCVFGAGVAIVGYRLYKGFKKNTVSELVLETIVKYQQI
jgi:serine/threonine protein kinase